MRSFLGQFESRSFRGPSPYVPMFPRRHFLSCLPIIPSDFVRYFGCKPGRNICFRSDMILGCDKQMFRFYLCHLQPQGLRVSDDMKWSGLTSFPPVSSARSSGWLSFSGEVAKHNPEHNDCARSTHERWLTNPVLAVGSRTTPFGCPIMAFALEVSWCIPVVG